jgi:putative membrane protein
MTLEGLTEFEAVRDFLYARMRGVKDSPHPAPTNVSSSLPEAELAATLKEVAMELRLLRASLRTADGRPTIPAKSGDV